MAQAKANQLRINRIPKAFYLGVDDFAEFMASDPPQAQVLFRGKPRLEPVHDGVPVRAIKGKDLRGNSKLYCTHGTGMSVPIS